MCVCVVNRNVSTIVSTKRVCMCVCVIDRSKRIDVDESIFFVLLLIYHRNRQTNTHTHIHTYIHTYIHKRKTYAYLDLIIVSFSYIYNMSELVASPGVHCSLSINTFCKRELASYTTYVRFPFHSIGLVHYL